MVCLILTRLCHKVDSPTSFPNKEALKITKTILITKMTQAQDSKQYQEVWRLLLQGISPDINLESTGPFHTSGSQTPRLIRVRIRMSALEKSVSSADKKVGTNSKTISTA